MVVLLLLRKREDEGKECRHQSPEFNNAIDKCNLLQKRNHGCTKNELDLIDVKWDLNYVL